MAVVDSRIIVELRNSVRECSEHGLIVATKWSSDLLLAIPLSKRQKSPSRSLGILPESHYQDPTNIDQAALEFQDQDQMSVARKYMEARQYTRAAHTLRGCSSTKALFISVYCQYLASERKALNNWHKLDNSRYQPPAPINTSLTELLDRVKGSLDPWLLFLKSLLLYRLSRSEEAIESAIASITGFPWNWSIWILLSDCIDTKEQLYGLLPRLSLPATHPLIHMFKIKTLGELHGLTFEEVKSCDILLDEACFPNSIWLMGLRARTLYELLDIAGAETQFQKNLVLDRYRIDDIDIYSNLLYRKDNKDNKASLSMLAQRYLELDKNRPEVCCLVGNHYSIRLDHERAIKYFRRATQLDRTYFHAWTLMGHEYSELSNYHAAIESYRRAIDVNKRDHRAWYGLGQAYIFLGMHHYALYYLQRASLLRPGDLSIWEGIGTCFEEIGQYGDAIASYKRCLESVDVDEDFQVMPIHAKMTKLYNAAGDYTMGATHSLKIIDFCEHQDGTKVWRNNSNIGEYLARAQEYLARAQINIAEHHMRALDGDLTVAHTFLEKAVRGNADDSIKSQAAEMLKAVRSRMARIGR